MSATLCFGFGTVVAIWTPIGLFLMFVGGIYVFRAQDKFFQRLKVEAPSVWTSIGRPTSIFMPASISQSMREARFFYADQQFGLPEDLERKRVKVGLISRFQLMLTFLVIVPFTLAFFFRCF